MSIEAQVQVLYRNIELMEATLEWREEGGFLQTHEPLPVGTSIQLHRRGMDDPVNGRVTHVVETRKKGRNNDAPTPGMMLSFVGAALFAQDELMGDDEFSTKVELPSALRAAENGDDAEFFVEPDIDTPVVLPSDEDAELARAVAEYARDVPTETEPLPEDVASSVLDEPDPLCQTPTLTEDPEEDLATATAIVNMPTEQEAASMEEEPPAEEPPAEEPPAEEPPAEEPPAEEPPAEEPPAEEP
ncbi:MAG: hypothetical protein JRH20_27310, partial [Deltaproteobacteria bacterium]|nr:hypothetical protein [Deltaproteobacteria bacterium]